MKLFKMLIATLCFVCSLNAHADMDFAYGLATGLSTGSGSSIVGAAIHNMNDSTTENDKSQYVQAQIPSEPSTVGNFIANVLFMICLVGIALFLLLIIALSILS